jgi:hypothetical protein
MAEEEKGNEMVLYCYKRRFDSLGRHNAVVKYR